MYSATYALNTKSPSPYIIATVCIVAAIHQQTHIIWPYSLKWYNYAFYIKKYNAHVILLDSFEAGLRIRVLEGSYPVLDFKLGRVRIRF